MILRELKPPRDHEVMNAVLQRGDALELARLCTLIAMITQDNGNPDRANPISRYVDAMLGGVFVALSLLARTDDDALILRISDGIREMAEEIEKSRASWLDDENPGRITGRDGIITLIGDYRHRRILWSVKGERWKNH